MVWISSFKGDIYQLRHMGTSRFQLKTFSEEGMYTKYTEAQWKAKEWLFPNGK